MDFPIGPHSYGGFFTHSMYESNNCLASMENKAAPSMSKMKFAIKLYFWSSDVPGEKAAFMLLLRSLRTSLFIFDNKSLSLKAVSFSDNRRSFSMLQYNTLRSLENSGYWCVYSCSFSEDERSISESSSESSSKSSAFAMSWRWPVISIRVTVFGRWSIATTCLPFPQPILHKQIPR